MRAALLGLVMAGCGAPTEDPGEGGICGAGAERVFVTSRITFARAVDGVSAGFDLDGTDDATCDVEDYVAPDGTPGVDNAMAEIMPVLDATEARALEPLIDAAIRSGELLLMIQVTGIDDTQDDDCVGVRMLRGRGVPSTGNDGAIEWHQTFDIDPDQPQGEEVVGTIVDGRVVARGLFFSMPIQIFDLDTVLDLHDAAVGLSLEEDGAADGVFAGALDWKSLVAALDTTGIDATLRAAMPALFGGLADLNPDEHGDCQGLSATLNVSGIPAFLFDDALPPTPPEDTGLTE